VSNLLDELKDVCENRNLDMNVVNHLTGKVSVILSYATENCGLIKKTVSHRKSKKKIKFGLIVIVMIVCNI
jgi:hypothetical protein